MCLPLDEDCKLASRKPDDILLIAFAQSYIVVNMKTEYCSCDFVSLLFFSCIAKGSQGTIEQARETNLWFCAI